MELNELLKNAATRGASDVHLKVGVYPVIRVNGRLLPMEEMGRLDRDWMYDTLFGIMSEKQTEQFKTHSDLDMAYSVPGLGRFRVNVYQQRGTVGAVLRVIPMKVLSIRELNLPAVLEELSMEQRGMILVTGTTGSGKSTTLAGMVDYINNHRNGHIVTIEDPIEYLHRDRMSLVNQREIGFDTESFAAALRHALRQDPDVIMVGEMRDHETISTALVAAETGHLVLSTLHTSDATETINRIISVFPPHQQQQIRIQLATVLQGIVSMRLVPRADGKGRVPAVEVLVATTVIRECIVKPERTKEIHDFIAAGQSQYGMQTFDQALEHLYAQELVTYEEAMLQATKPDDFALKVKGVMSLDDIAKEQEKSIKEKHRKPGKKQGSDLESMKVDRFDRK